MTERRYDRLSASSQRYGELAKENYDRVRALAEALRSGFCAYLDSGDPPCVLLVPPAGPFEPKDAGDHAFSIPPGGFQPLGPISFGFAVRVQKPDRWLRVTLTCVKEADMFEVQVAGGGAYAFKLPLADQDPDDFFQHLYNHIVGWFEAAISDYEHGEYGSRGIGFDFAQPQDVAAD